MCNTGIECVIKNNDEKNINIIKNITNITNIITSKNNIENNIIIYKECNDIFIYTNKASKWAFSMNFPKDFPLY